MGSEYVQPPVKDGEAAHPVATAWREPFRDVVKAFKQGDYALATNVPMVIPVPSATANQIKAYVLDYGETLADLPEETWGTSVAQWMGTHWDVLVDLWTVESGRSDMVMSARVFEVGTSFRIEIELVYVP
jgi:hypothetical protein